MFFATSIYIIISLTQMLFVLRAFGRSSQEGSPEGIRPALAALQKRLANIRQILLFTILLFVLCFLLQIPAAFIVLSDSKVPVLSIIFMQLGTYIGYATDIILVFLLLHSLQWFVSVRVQSIAHGQYLY
jgi:hypothetical protein